MARTGEPISHEELLARIKENLEELGALLNEVNDEWVYEDKMYRFYHHSFKVYSLQDRTMEIVRRLEGLMPGHTLDGWFLQIVAEGTGKRFKSEDNQRWTDVTRPILEAFFHARYFLEMAVKYGRALHSAARADLPSGWAALLELYGIRYP